MNITGNLTPEQKEHYSQNGYVIRKKFFYPSEINRIKEDAQYIFGLQLASHGYSYYWEDDTKFEEQLYKLFKDHPQTIFNCGKHIQHLVSLHKLSLDTRILNTLNDLGLNFPTICTRPVLYFNTRHLSTKEIYHTMPAHQDFYSMQGSTNSVVVWVPLIDVTTKIGALQIVPSSHKEGLTTSENQEGFGVVTKYNDSDFVSVELSQGDALFFSSYLVHRSGINSTDSIRWSCHFRYNDVTDKDFIQRQYPHPYIYKPISKIESET